MQALTSRLRGGLGPVAALALALSACAHAPEPVERPAELRVIAEPDTTSVYINNRYAGRAKVLAVNPKSLKPGVKYVTFKAPGHFPHDMRLELPAGETKIVVKLRPVPP